LTSITGEEQQPEMFLTGSGAWAWETFLGEGEREKVRDLIKERVR